MAQSVELTHLRYTKGGLFSNTMGVPVIKRLALSVRADFLRHLLFFQRRIRYFQNKPSEISDPCSSWRLCEFQRLFSCSRGETLLLCFWAASPSTLSNCSPVRSPALFQTLSSSAHPRQFMLYILCPQPLSGTHPVFSRPWPRPLISCSSSSKLSVLPVHSAKGLLLLFL